MITITHIVPPEHGWPILAHCPICQSSTIFVDPWVLPTRDGSPLRLVDVCVDPNHYRNHNLRLSSVGGRTDEGDL